MSFPFGGHPKLQQFLEFAAEHGCTAKLVTRTSRTGQAYQVLEIRRSTLGRVILADPNMNGYRLSGTVDG
jgi:hypothetical protein